MPHPLEGDFREWSKPPTATEDARCSNAESVVRNAINSYPGFATRNIEVFAQGSYRNGTNVRANSDVDVCVRCTDVCFVDLPDGYSDSNFGLVDASYSYAAFKNDVENALKAYLGAAAVSRGKKAFDLHANTYRVDADVVPTFEHRRYAVANGSSRYISGTELHPDGGGRIVNWPHQNYENVTSKNNATGTRFKKLVRVLNRDFSLLCYVHLENKGRGLAVNPEEKLCQLSFSNAMALNALLPQRFQRSPDDFRSLQSEYESLTRRERKRRIATESAHLKKNRLKPRFLTPELEEQVIKDLEDIFRPAFDAV